MQIWIDNLQSSNFKDIADWFFLIIWFKICGFVVSRIFVAIATAYAIALKQNQMMKQNAFRCFVVDSSLSIFDEFGMNNN